MHTTYQPMIARLFSENRSIQMIQKAALVLVGTLLLTLSAKIQIPFYPVNTTMQTFAVIMLGFLYGKSLGFLTVAAYLLEGAMGLPVFTSTPERGIGLAYMMGPTAGYLLGFLGAAYCAGMMAERGWGRTILSSAGVFMLGAMVIDVPGLIWLNALVGTDAMLATFLSYQLAYLLKTGLGAFLLPIMNSMMNKTN